MRKSQRSENNVIDNENDTSIKVMKFDSKNGNMQENSISEYEQLRQENIQRNEQFLSSIGIANKPINVINKSVASKRGVTPKIKNPIVIAQRRSSRVTIEKLSSELKDAESSGLTQELLDIKKKELEDLKLLKSESKTHEKYLEIETENYAINRITSEEFSIFPSLNVPVGCDSHIFGKDIINEFSNADKSMNTKSIKDSMQKDYKNDYIKRLQKLSICDNEVAKLTESRITQTWIHHSETNILVAAGDKQGHIGFWNVNSTTSDGIYKYKPHVESIIKLSSCLDNPSKMYSGSYDGTIRFFDIDKEAFVLGFQAPEDLNEVSFTDIDFTNNHECAYIARKDGKIAFIDMREGNKNSYSWCYQVHNFKVNSVQLHPTNNNILISASSTKDGYICIHDIRTANKNWKCINQLDEHNKSINAAYASPDGNFLVSVAQDETVKTFVDFTNNMDSVSNHSKNSNYKVHSFRHNNHTGRWLSTFRPTFDPKQAHSFILGSMEHPRRIGIFSTTLINSLPSLYPEFTITDDNLNSVCSRNCFHPTKDIIVAGNSSGRVHIFK